MHNKSRFNVILSTSKQIVMSCEFT